MTSYKKTHRVRRRTKHQKRRSLKRKIVKSMKVAKWIGGGPGEVGFNYSQYNDRDFKVMRTSGIIEDGWKFVVPHKFEPRIGGVIQLTKDGKFKFVSYEDLVKDNPWFI